MILHTPTRTQMDGRTHLQAMEVHMRTYKPTDAKADTLLRVYSAPQDFPTAFLAQIPASFSLFVRIILARASVLRG